MDLLNQVVAGEVGVIGSELLEPLLVFVEYSSAITTSILKRLELVNVLPTGHVLQPEGHQIRN